MCSFPSSVIIDGAKSASVKTFGLKGHSLQEENPAMSLSSVKAFMNATPNNAAMEYKQIHFPGWFACLPVVLL